MTARFLIAGVTLQQNGPKEICWYVNGGELARTRHESEGEQLVSFAVPDAWLSTGELTRAKLRVTNPYIAEDRVKLGVMMREIGFE